MKILVVEDEAQARRLYRQILEQDGYKVVSAESTFKGLELLEAAGPDLIVFEAHMPDANGLEIMGRLMDRHPRIPVLMVSAHWTEDDDQLRSTADAYLPVPSDARALRSTVRRLLEPHAM